MTASANVLSDEGAGILSTLQTRNKMKEIHNSTHIASREVLVATPNCRQPQLRTMALEGSQLRCATANPTGSRSRTKYAGQRVNLMVLGVAANHSVSAISIIAPIGHSPRESRRTNSPRHQSCRKVRVWSRIMTNLPHSPQIGRTLAKDAQASLELQQGLDRGKGKGIMTPTGLTDFLLARIAEDEASASAVIDIGAEERPIDGFPRSLDLDSLATYSTEQDQSQLAQRFDPARVLADCDAKRLIMAIHSAYAPIGDPVYALDWSSNDWCVGCSYHSNEERVTEHIEDCPILRALALPFATHPDFRSEWN